ncbi:class I SAM-dependent methyltransferase [Sorangium sp. So ce1078]|uniref:class I SAM-dependent methyltransferase n=1 Tax=Sorangium sp. So ce1078 TaxID=3133329 RepID=UPI003F629BDA
MNRLHRWLCSSRVWARGVARDYLPWALAGVDLGDEVLEIGPGYGATTRVLLERVRSLTALELDDELAGRLRDATGDRVRVVRGDGTQMPFEAASFTAVTCFTMLHHIPSAALQDRLFAEARRVLRPGGVFAGADSLPSLGFRLLHVRDTMVPVDPSTLPRRLAAAGFHDIEVATSPGRALKFRARR